MEIPVVISFLGAAIILTILPGPDNMFVLAQSIAKGKNAGIFTTLGLCTGLLVHISAATIGISAVIYQSAFAFIIVKYAGAAYLLYLAFKSFRSKESSFNLNTSDTLNGKSLYKKGVIMNLLNPKVSLFFVAFLPQFVNYENGSVPIQMLILGFLFLVQALIIFSLISLFAGSIGAILRKNTFLAKKFNIIEGILYILIGLNIAFSQK